jgi:hypothetical protein
VQLMLVPPAPPLVIIMAPEGSELVAGLSAERSGLGGIRDCCSPAQLDGSRSPPAWPTLRHQAGQSRSC